MRHRPNFRFLLLILIALVIGAALFAASAFTQQSTQERAVWDVQMARNAQASSTITIQNQCQQSHTFSVTDQQTPFLQLLAAPTVNVPGNSSYNLPVRFNTNGMSAGQYQGIVVVKCETCRKEKTCKQDREILPVRLNVLQDDVLQRAGPQPGIPPQAIPKATPSPTPSPAPAGATPSPGPSPSPSPCAPAPTPTTYSVKDLSTLSESDTAHCIATGVNDGGNVVGACSPSYFGASGGAWHAFRTESGAVIKKEDDLGFPVGITGGTSFATAVNGKGHVVGFWTPTGKAFWHDGGKTSKMTNLHPAKSIFTVSKAFALNSSDDVVGVAYGPTVKPGSALGMTFGGHAVLWPHADPASIIDLNDYMDPSSKKDWILIAAFGINDAKEIVGRALDLHLGKYHAFLLKGKGAKPIDLGALKEDGTDSSAAYAINACGDAVPAIDKVVGYTYTKKDSYYGFVWTKDSGMMEMGTLPGYSESYAQAINKKGEVVGAVWDHHTSVIFDGITCLGTCYTKPTGDAYSHAVWYNGGELKDLNKLIPAHPGWELEFANGINDKGQIAESGFYKPPTYKGGGLYAKAVLLTPASLTPPATASAGATSSSCPLAIAKGYIFDNWNICGVKNGPSKDSTFTIDKDYLITFIATYHWNDGKGALPGKKGISVKNSTGKVFGPWTVITSAGSGGINVNWECHPGITLPAGTYTIIDPDPSTWSQNDASGNSGFARVAGSPSKK